MPLPKVLAELLALPTAAFVESAVLEYVRAFCGGCRGVSVQADRYGNLLARYRYQPRGATPLVFAAHTDHPGFVAQEMLDGRTVRAAFRGYVESPYFANARMRFWSGGRWIPGRVGELTRTVAVNRMGHQTSRPGEVLVRVGGPVEPGSPGMWDLPAARLRGDNVHAVALDDLAGVAAMLALLERLSRKRARAEAYCLFTRGEEAGLVGAVAAAKGRTIPRALPIVAIETSMTLPTARIGEGPILRVGDRMSVFTPDLTTFCGRVAGELAKRRKSFVFQRKLMDGGTCESTAYLLYGYRTTGVCLALGNYHNMDRERGKIAPECISLSDWHGMVDWFEALATDTTGYVPGPNVAIRADLEKRLAACLPLLRSAKTKATPAKGNSARDSARRRSKASSAACANPKLI